MEYKLLSAFERIFLGPIPHLDNPPPPYLHRNSVLGDYVAMHFYEDLYDLGDSSSYVSRVANQQRLLNTGNMRRGIKARRGDGTFGQPVPHTPAIDDPGFVVARGQLATVEVGAEVKILAKAMVKQIGRVMSDLQDQVRHFHRGGGKPLTLGIVGVNHAEVATSYEGDRSYTTTGTASFRHPIQEAHEVIARLNAEARPHFDEFLILKYVSTNSEPWNFSWVNRAETAKDYGAVLVRISRAYQQRF